MCIALAITGPKNISRLYVQRIAVCKAIIMKRKKKRSTHGTGELAMTDLELMMSLLVIGVVFVLVWLKEGW